MLLAPFVLGSPHRPTISAEGAGCPCLSQVDVMGARHNHPWILSPADVTFLTNGNPKANASTYGVGCHQHDASLSWCAEPVPIEGSSCDNVVPSGPSCPSRPNWCGHEWCWVDTTRCTVNHRPTAFFPNTPRFYSYAACGDPNAFYSDPDRVLRGRVLRVGYRQNLGGTHGSYHPVEGNGGPQHRDDRWYGPYPEIVTAAALKGGFSLNITEIPEHVLLKARAHALVLADDSGVSECAYAVGLGYLDVCVVQAAITNERGRLADFLALEELPMHLIVGVEHDAPTVGEMVGAVFAPYSARTWLCLVVAVVVFSAIFALQERGLNVGERVLVGGARAHGGGASVGGRVTGVGMTFFFFLVATSYIANLTSLYVTSTASGSVGSIQQAIEQNLAVCVAQDRVAQMALQYPGVRLATDPKMASDPLFKGVRNASDVFGYIDQGVCAAAVAPLNELHSQHSQGKHCRKLAVGGTVITQAVGMPVTYGERGQALKHVLGELVDGGEWRSTVQKNSPPSQCPSLAASTSGSLDLTDVAGMFIVAIVFCVVGVLVTILERGGILRGQCRVRGRARAKSHGEDNARPTRLNGLALGGKAMRMRWPGGGGGGGGVGGSCDDGGGGDGGGDDEQPDRRRRPSWDQGSPEGSVAGSARSVRSAGSAGSSGSQAARPARVISLESCLESSPAGVESSPPKEAAHRDAKHRSDLAHDLAYSTDASTDRDDRESGGEGSPEGRVKPRRPGSPGKKKTGTSGKERTTELRHGSGGTSTTRRRSTQGGELSPRSRSHPHADGSGRGAKGSGAKISRNGRRPDFAGLASKASKSDPSCASGRLSPRPTLRSALRAPSSPDLAPRSNNAGPACSDPGSGHLSSSVI